MPFKSHQIESNGMFLQTNAPISNTHRIQSIQLKQETSTWTRDTHLCDCRTVCGYVFSTGNSVYSLCCLILFLLQRVSLFNRHESILMIFLFGLHFVTEWKKKINFARRKKENTLDWHRGSILLIFTSSTNTRITFTLNFSCSVFTWSTKVL